MAVLTPPSLAEALRALADRPDAQVLAGGTDFMVEVNFGHRRPVDVVSLTRVEELQGWHHDAAGARVRLGAGLTYAAAMDPALAVLVPALAEASRTVGSPQIRATGTIGGNLGTCSPAGDALPVLSALDAEVELASASGTRVLDVHEFMVGVKRTALAPGELVVAATVPVLDGWQGYAKVGVRNAMVISVCSCCLAVDRSGRSVRVALGAVGPTVIRARDAEAWVAGELPWDGGAVPEALAAEFGRRVAAEARPITDHRSTAEYRRHAVGVLAARQLRRAFP
jgi:CO/xanthine dehydrogenase FAD-binding subunit